MTFNKAHPRTGYHFRLKQVSLLALFACLTPLAQAQGTLDKIKSSGSITISYRDGSIPFSYTGPNGEPMGFAWDICQKIAENIKSVTGRHDLKINRQMVTSQNRIPLLQNGTIDMECGSTTNNTTRNKEVDFAINYFYTGTRFLVKASSNIKSIDDLKNKVVASTTGTTNLQILRRMNATMGLDFNLMATKDHPEGALLVQSGRADAFGMDDILLYGLKGSSARPDELKVVGDPIQVEPYAIMVRKGDPEFKKVVDNTLSTLMKNGEFEALYKKWFQSPTPPRGINLNVPMSDDLRKNLTEQSDAPAN